MFRLLGGVIREAEGVRHNLVAYGGVMTLAQDTDESGRTSYICLRHAYNESKKYRHGELVAFNGNKVGDPNAVGSVAMINAIRGVQGELLSEPMYFDEILDRL